MSQTPLKSTRSPFDGRVKLITPVKQEQMSPTGNLSNTFTSLRRSTRSTVNKHLPLDLSEKDDSPVSTSHKRPKIESSVASAITSPANPSTPKSASKKPMPLAALDKPHAAPVRWEEQYRLIERMRKGIVAPVDDMGCERPRNTVGVDPKTLRFHMLISLMLSSQTKDPVTSQAVTNLHHELSGGLTAESLAAASVEQVHECINKVGFWRRKTDYIQEAARKLLERQGEERGDVPNTLEGLCELKGVGPKMAFLALQCAWDINAGIGVDVHVHRITNRLRWHKPPTTTPEQTRLNLQSWLPAHLHKPINPMMVGFGQIICLPVGPRCDVCLLSQKKICPSRVSNIKAGSRKEIVYSFAAEDGDGNGVAKVEVKYDDRSPSIKAEIKEEVVDELDVRKERVLGMLNEVDGVEKI